MKTNDGRKLSHETLEEIRIRAVRQVIEEGKSPERVIEMIGFSRCLIYKWLKVYKKKGYEGLKSKPHMGRPMKLSEKQLRKLSKVIISKNPLQLKFDYALWTLPLIKEYIKREFGFNLHTTTVSRILKKLGFSPQKPLHRAYQRDETLVKQWMDEEFENIKKMAKTEKADIYFGDEASIRSDYHAGTTWSKIGKTPIVESTGARFSLNMISAISTRGAHKFMVINKRLNSELFIEFLKKLIFRQKRKIFLVLDGYPVHKSKKVKEFVESTNGKLSIFFLPPYSPDLNPDELVWGYIKKNNIGRSAVKTYEQMKRMVLKSLDQLSSSPKIIKNFIKHIYGEECIC